MNEEKNTFLLNTYGLGPTNKDVMIKFNKFLSEIKKEYYEEEAQKICKLCGEKDIKYCNSHTIPQFILRKISNDGYLYNPQIFNNTLLKHKENGLKEIQVFHSICTVCDSSKFQEYEQEDNYTIEPTQLMLKQIALKNYLSRSCKWLEEKKTLNICRLKAHDEKVLFFEKLLNKHLKKKVIDIEYANKQIELVNKSLKTSNNIYKLCYYKKLDYIIPYTIQGPSPIFYGFSNKLLNNPFAKNSNNIEDLHICMFPLEEKSIIIAFCEANTNIYNSFFEQLMQKKISEQLSILNFIIFAYYEDIFISKQLNKSVLENVNLQQLTQQQPAAISLKSKKDSMKNILKQQQILMKKTFNIDKHSMIPNLLDIKYSIQSS